jgi:ATP-dependent Zn protease
MVIGNSLDETAYHEAGHIIIAAAVGLDLQHKGIIVYEVENVGEGWAFYWEDNQQWKDIFTGLRAGHLAQLKRFPGSYSLGAEIDLKKFSTLSQSTFRA